MDTAKAAKAARKRKRKKVRKVRKAMVVIVVVVAGKFQPCKEEKLIDIAFCIPAVMWSYAA